ncbi:MAG TPA: hypothetical protein VGD80_06775 [Kofleriaceae bacterium]
MSRIRIAMIAPVGLLALAPGRAGADGQSLHPGVGGHIGLATPLVTITSDDTTSIADQFTLAVPIGIGLKLTEKATIDFETVVGNPISPRGTTGLTVDPGIIYDMGSFAIGLRLAWKVQADTNFGVIPVIHKDIAELGGRASWFVEAALPSFISVGADPANTGEDKATVEVNVVLHTGVGF